MNEVVQALRTTTEQLRKLDVQIVSALEKQDTTGFVQKLEERASVLAELPERISNPLKNVKKEVRQKIQDNLNPIASTAKSALNNGGTFSLLVLSTDKLEKLIDSLIN